MAASFHGPAGPCRSVRGCPRVAPGSQHGSRGGAVTTTQSRPGLLSTAGLVVVTLLTLLAVWTASAGGRWSAEFGPIENADLEPPPLPETPPPPPPPPTGDVGF